MATLRTLTVALLIVTISAACSLPSNNPNFEPSSIPNTPTPIVIQPTPQPDGYSQVTGEILFYNNYPDVDFLLWNLEVAADQSNSTAIKARVNGQETKYLSTEIVGTRPVEGLIPFYFETNIDYIEIVICGQSQILYAPASNTTDTYPINVQCSTPFEPQDGTETIALNQEVQVVVVENTIYIAAPLGNQTAIPYSIIANGGIPNNCGELISSITCSLPSDTIYPLTLRIGQDNTEVKLGNESELHLLFK